MRKLLTLIIVAFSVTSFLNAQDCAEIFFSEYVEGTDNSKAIEIYNPTKQIVDLSKYYVARFSNGSSNYDGGGITQLQGFLLSKEVFILVNGQTEDLTGSTKCSPELQAKATMLDHTYPAPMYMNGNDAIALLKDPVGDGNPGDFVGVDLFGTIGGGMGSTDEGWTNFTNQYTYKNVKDLNGDIIGKDSILINNYIVPTGWFWLPWSANHTLVRKPEVMKGVSVDPGIFNLTLEWDTLSSVVNDWSNLGVHNCRCATLSTPKENEISISQVYPNPVLNNSFTLETNKPILNVETLNITGQIVKSRATNLNGYKTKVFVDEEIKGLLFIRITLADQETILNKVVFQ